MAEHNTADRIFSRAGEVPPPPRSGAASPATERARRVIGGAERDTLTRPPPSSPPLQGEETEWARFVGVGVVAIYRAAISPVIHALNGPACRFEPSCSEYARDAIAMHGMVRGGAMAIWRIARCNPVGGHGFDPVPATTGRILSRAPTTRALIGPSPSSSPSQGEGTEPSSSRLSGAETP